MHRIVIVAALVAVFGLPAAPASAQEAAAPPATGLTGVPIDHLGLVVRDLETTTQAYVDVLGLPAPAIREEKGLVFPAGSKADPNAWLRTATFQLNGVALKLMQPMGGASPWREHLDKYGDGLHTMAFAGVKDVAGVVAAARALGGTQVVGGPGAKTAAVDLRSQLGFTLQVSEAPGTGASTMTPPPAAERKFGQNPILYISVIVPSNKEALPKFAKLMGVAEPASRAVKIPYPPGSGFDADAGPELAMVPLKGGISVAYTSPYGGKSPWSESVRTHGPTMHHPGVGVPSVPDAIDYLEGKGGSVVIGGREAGFAWTDHTSRLAILFELNRRQ